MLKSFSPNPIRTFEKVGKLRFYQKGKGKNSVLRIYATL